jgi:hypothetical protein
VAALACVAHLRPTRREGEPKPRQPRQLAPKPTVATTLASLVSLPLTSYSELFLTELR